MAENKIKRILLSKASLFLMMLAVIWLGLRAVQIGYKKYQLSQEVANLKAEISKTDQRKQELAQLLDYFSSPNYLEKEAKEKLNVKKEGESVLIVSGAGEENAEPFASASVKTTASFQEDSNLIKWWKFFFRR